MVVEMPKITSNKTKRRSIETQAQLRLLRHNKSLL